MVHISYLKKILLSKSKLRQEKLKARKTAIPQDKLLGLVNLVLTATWYTLNSQFYQQTDGAAIGEQASSTTAEFICKYTLQKFGSNLLMTFIPFLNVCT